jgi:uncharacterized delta-60 repeat protein
MLEELMPSTTKQLGPFFVLATLICANVYAAAQAGSLDPTFGNNGIATTSLRAATASALQSDGKIVLAGLGDSNSQFYDTLTRLNSDGSIDTSFGVNGVANFQPGSGSGLAPFGFFAMAIEPNGEIVAAALTQGLANGIYTNFVQVARVEANGTLDASFGSGGFTVTRDITFTPNNVTGPQAIALGLESNGSIVVASSYFNLMARFTNHGQLDTTFGSGGLVNLANPGPNTTSAPTQIVVEKNGKILVASGSTTPTPTLQSGTISRYNSNGTLDTTFGAAGSAASVASASALLVESDGEIVVAGSLTSKVNAAPAGNDVGFGVVRYTANGMIDKTFGSGGVAVADFGTGAPLSGAFAVAVQANGEVVAGGAAAQGELSSSFDSAFGLARFTSAGLLDSSFGTGGLVTTTLVSGSTNVYSYVNGLMIQSDGKIVAAGDTSVGQGFEAGTLAYVARYLAQ